MAETQQGPANHSHVAASFAIRGDELFSHAAVVDGILKRNGRRNCWGVVEEGKNGADLSEAL